MLALDVPSGVDTATGTVFGPAVRAEATLTLALPKAGLKSRAAREHVGELYLADISQGTGNRQKPGHQGYYARRVGVLHLDGKEQNGPEGGQAQDYRNDDAAAYQGWKQIADSADQRVDRHPNRVKASLPDSAHLHELLEATYAVRWLVQ